MLALLQNNSSWYVDFSKFEINFFLKNNYKCWFDHDVLRAVIERSIIAKNLTSHLATTE